MTVAANAVTLLILLSYAWAADNASAQMREVSATNAKSDDRRALDELRSRLTALPKEIECHFLLKLIEQGKIPSREQRLTILEEIFVQARSVTYPFRIVVSEPINPRGGSDIGLLDDSMQHGIDALSLRSRAVELLAAENPKRAREFMEELSSVAPPPLDCRDGYGYSMKRYWEALTVVFEKGFSSQEREEAKHMAFAEARLRSVHSAFDILPAMRFLAKTKMSNLERRFLVNAFAGTVNQLEVDARSFQVSLIPDWNVSAVALARLVNGFEAGDAAQLVQALKAYLVKNSSGLLCRESFVTKYRGQGQTFNEFLAKFNEAVVPLSGGNLEPIQPVEDLTRRDKRLVGPTGAVREFWESSDSAPLLRAVKQLRFGGEEDRASIEALPPRPGRPSNPLPIEKRMQLEWQRQADEFLRAMDNWREKSKEDTGMIVHQTCVLYTALLDTLPPGPVRQAVTLNFARFIEKDVAPNVTPPEWLHHILNFMDLGTAGGQNREALLEILDQQGGRSAAYVAYVRASGDLALAMSGN